MEAQPLQRLRVQFLASFPSSSFHHLQYALFFHTASDEMLEAGKAWE